jgi:hypothetical protein
LRILNTLNAIDSAEEILEENAAKFSVEITALLTKSMKNSTSSEAWGAFLSVLEYHGGLVKGPTDVRSAFGSSLSCLLLKRKAHLILSFLSQKSSSKDWISGGSIGVGLKLGPLERREIMPGETISGTSLTIRGLKFSVEKGTTVMGEEDIRGCLNLDLEEFGLGAGADGVGEEAGQDDGWVDTGSGTEEGGFIVTGSVGF